MFLTALAVRLDIPWPTLYGWLRRGRLTAVTGGEWIWLVELSKVEIEARPPSAGVHQQPIGHPQGTVLEKLHDKPINKIWQHLRARYLSHRGFPTIDPIIAARWAVWNMLTRDTDCIRSP